MKILLIAGHGNGDCGAVGCGYKEADLTREMVKLIKPKLSNYATVEIADTSVNWFNNRTKLPLSGVDYALEVHFNACVNDTKGNGVTTGTEIYVTTSEKGITVEENIIKGIASLGLKNRGVKRKNWSVINYCKGKGISAALLETCFIDDADDMKIYTAKKDLIAEAITSGIVTGFGLKKTTVAEKPVNTNKLDPAQSFSKSYAKAYRVTTNSGLNMRSGAGTNKTLIATLPKGATFRCYGYYTKQADGTVWLYGVCEGKTGYCSKAYLA